MLSEAKILLENIRHFRQLITEGVSDQTIVDAINEHKYLYIYYKGDTTIETGYRTIRPFVLGVNTSGNLAVRAWQDKGRSDSLRPDSPRNRLGHEHHTDTDGKTKAGWRLFLIDNITRAYPTGKKFNDAQGRVLIPPGYKENDADMTGGIVASVSAHPEKELQSGTTAATITSKQRVPKWQSFLKANVNSRKPKPVDIENLYTIAKRVMKQTPNDFFVAIDDQNQFSLKDMRIKSKFPQNAIVGDLSHLYDTLVKKNAPRTPQEDAFFKQNKQKLDKEANNPKQNNPEAQKEPVIKENEKFPVKWKTFFKQ